MLNLSSSNLIMAFLLSAKASLLLVTPAQSALSTSSNDLASHSSVEVEVINLSNDSTESSESSWLLADADVDQNQDVNQDTDRNQASQTSFIYQV